MVMLSPAKPIETPGAGRDGGYIPPPGHGGGDGSGEDGSPDYGQQLVRARTGLVFVLAPILTMFVVLTVAYTQRQRTIALDQNSHSYTRHWLLVNLPVRLLLLNTFVLLCSSFMVEMARRQLRREVALSPIRSIPGVSLGHEHRLPWLAATLVLGMSFLGGQFVAWRELAARGFELATSASSSFVYLLTAAHAVHLALGLLVLFYAQGIALLHKPLEQRHIVVDVTAWYWHFMALLWIYIFALLTLLP